MWLRISIGLAIAISVLYFYYVDRCNKLVNKFNRMVDKYNSLMKDYNALVKNTDKNIDNLKDRIEQISITNGISFEYKERMKDLEKQSVKDKEQIVNYETELSNCKTDIDNCNRLVDTLRSDIVKMKSKGWTDRFSKYHSPSKPSKNVNIQLKDIPKQSLIQAIHFFECNSIGLTSVSFKKIVNILGYPVSVVNCRTVGFLLKDMHFVVKRYKNHMVLSLNNNRNRKKLSKFYVKYGFDKK